MKTVEQCILKSGRKAYCGARFVLLDTEKHPGAKICQKCERALEAGAPKVLELRPEDVEALLVLISNTLQIDHPLPARHFKRPVVERWQDLAKRIGALQKNEAHS